MLIEESILGQMNLHSPNLNDEISESFDLFCAFGAFQNRTVRVTSIHVQEMYVHIIYDVLKGDIIYV